VTRDGLLLGVDGGNTKTIALLARGDGTVVGAGRAFGCADIHAVAVEAALDVVRHAVDGAAESMVDAHADGAHGDLSLVQAAFSMAGADWPEDHDELRRALGSRWPAPVVVNDAIGALRAAIPDGPGVIVVAGTGAATGARGPDGSTWHSSFWQEAQGAHELGISALRAIYRAELGIDPPTSLTRRILEALDAPDVATVLHRQARRDPARWREAHTLAPVLLDAAEAGDRTASDIVLAHGNALAAMALAASRRVGIDPTAPFALALAGGLFRHHGSMLRDALRSSVLAGAPGAREIQPAFEPVTGALLLAFDAAGIPIDDGVLARLRATLPGDALFDTRLPAGSAEGG
jgi:N-acetylglucosamine kinase-like BadF-type ATPase